jgi:integrase
VVAYRKGQIPALRARLKTVTPMDALALGVQVERLLTTVKATKSPQTYRQYVQNLNCLIERFGKDTLLTDITSDDLQTYLHEPKATTKTKGPWSPARQLVAYALIGRLFNVAIKKELEAAHREKRDPRISMNPLHNVELSEDANPRVEFLRPAEWQTLSKTVEGRPSHALVALGTLAGLRISETANLRRDIDVVNLETDRAYIEVQPRGGAYPWKTKTKQSVRRVPVRGELGRILRGHIESGYAGDRYLIVTPGRDRPVQRAVLARWTEKAFGAAGIEYGRNKDALTYHSLRHSFISWLVQSDVSLKKISRLAGTSIEMIDKVYGHLIDDDLTRALDVVDKLAVSGATSSEGKF